MIRIFTGYDEREAEGWHAFAQSALKNTSIPFSIAPLSDAVARDGSNAFTYSRFMVPQLCEYRGFAVFVDGADMIAKGDLAELWALRDESKAVQVVQHEYKTKYPRKYLGTDMESANRDYPRKNWSSVIIWNCAHKQNAILTPEFVAMSSGEFLHRFGWLNDEEIGALPGEWNWLADEYGSKESAKLLHWTVGIPGIWAHRKAPHAQAWFYYASLAKRVPWVPLKAQGDRVLS